MIGLHSLNKDMMVPVEHLLREPFIRIVAYPYDGSDDALLHAKEMVREMDLLGVRGILLGGRSIVNGLPVLGKGCTSIVVKAVLDGYEYRMRNSSDSESMEECHSNAADNGVIALKMMRQDSGRASMEHEADMLAAANRVGVGPRLMAYSRNLLAMELIDGIHLIEVIRGLDGMATHHSTCGGIGYDRSRDKDDIHTIHIKHVVQDILEQCFILDMVGLDHGELNNMSRHVMIGNRVCIIDFESSSMKRRVSNVTSATSYLLFGRGRVLAMSLQAKRYEILDALRRYRLDMSRARFHELLALMDLI